MTKKIGILVFVVCLIVAQGCIPSLHPLYTADKIVYLDILEGVWEDQPGDVQIRTNEKIMGEEKDVIVTMKDDGSSKPAIWDFSNNDEGGYLLIHQDDNGIKAAFDVFVVKLGNDYFLDFYPTDMPDEGNSISDIFDDGQNDLMVFHLLRVHTFAKLEINGDEIEIKLFDPDFLDKLLEQRKVRIKHELLVDGNYVLTAQPDELQKFVEKYAANNKLYIEDAIVLNKAKRK